MRIEAELCHIEAQCCVVRVSGWDGDIAIGSAIGQGATAEEAEDRALERLCSRLLNSRPATRQELASSSNERQPAASEAKKQAPQAQKTTQPATSKATPQEHTKSISRPTVREQEQVGPAEPRAEKPVRQPLKRHPAPQSTKTTPAAPTSPASGDAAKNLASDSPSDSPSEILGEIPSDSASESPREASRGVASETPSETTNETPSEAPTDPDDWSDELAAIDMQLQRIGWDRDQEKIYLNRAFGHSSRHRLTRYADLVAYLKRLEGLQPGEQAEAAPVPMRRSDLLSQSDQLLQQLSWSADQGKKLLKEHLGAGSRQQLSDEQLLNFNMILEEELIKTKQ